MAVARVNQQSLDPSAISSVLDAQGYGDVIQHLAMRSQKVIDMTVSSTLNEIERADRAMRTGKTIPPLKWHVDQAGRGAIKTSFPDYKIEWDDHQVFTGHPFDRSTRLLARIDILRRLNIDYLTRPAKEYPLVAIEYGANPSQGVHDGLEYVLHVCPVLGDKDAFRAEESDFDIENLDTSQFPPEKLKHVNNAVRKYAERDSTFIQRCRAEEAVGTAKYSFSIHALYDIGLTNLCKAMMRADSDRHIGVVHYSPIMEYFTEGVLPGSGQRFEKYSLGSQVHLRSYHVDEVAVAYDHNWDVLTSLVRNQSIQVDVDGESGYFVLDWDFRPAVSLLFITVVRVRTGYVPPSRQTLVSALGMMDKYMLYYSYDWMTSPPVFSRSDRALPLGDLIDKHKIFVRRVVSKELFLKVQAAVVGAVEGKFLPNTGLKGILSLVLRAGTRSGNYEDLHTQYTLRDLMGIAIDAMVDVFRVRGDANSAFAARVNNSKRLRNGRSVITTMIDFTKNLFSRKPAVGEVFAREYTTSVEDQWRVIFDNIDSWLSVHDTLFEGAVFDLKKLSTFTHESEGFCSTSPRKGPNSQPSTLPFFTPETIARLQAAESKVFEGLDYTQGDKYNCQENTIIKTNEGAGLCLWATFRDLGLFLSTPTEFFRRLQTSAHLKLFSDATELKRRLTAEMATEVRGVPRNALYLAALEFGVRICVHRDGSCVRFGSGPVHHVNYRERHLEALEVVMPDVQPFVRVDIDSEVEGEYVNLDREFDILRQMCIDQQKDFDDEIRKIRRLMNPADGLDCQRLFPNRCYMKATEVHAILKKDVRNIRRALCVGAPGAEAALVLKCSAGDVYGVSLKAGLDWYKPMLSNKRFIVATGELGTGDLTSAKEASSIGVRIRDHLMMEHIDYASLDAYPTNNNDKPADEEHFGKLLVGQVTLLNTIAGKNTYGYLKINRLRDANSLLAVEMLRRMFSQVIFCKLHTSRKLSLERHVVFSGFLGRLPTIPTEILTNGQTIDLQFENELRCAFISARQLVQDITIAQGSTMPLQLESAIKAVPNVVIPSTYERSGLVTVEDLRYTVGAVDTFEQAVKETYEKEKETAPVAQTKQEPTTTPSAEAHERTALKNGMLACQQYTSIALSIITICYLAHLVMRPRFNAFYAIQVIFVSVVSALFMRLATKKPTFDRTPAGRRPKLFTIRPGLLPRFSNVYMSRSIVLIQAMFYVSLPWILLEILSPYSFGSGCGFRLLGRTLMFFKFRIPGHGLILFARFVDQLPFMSVAFYIAQKLYTIIYDKAQDVMVYDVRSQPLETRSTYASEDLLAATLLQNRRKKKVVADETRDEAVVEEPGLAVTQVARREVVEPLALTVTSDSRTRTINEHTVDDRVLTRPVRYSEGVRVDHPAAVQSLETFQERVFPAFRQKESTEKPTTVHQISPLTNNEKELIKNAMDEFCDYKEHVHETNMSILTNLWRNFLDMSKEQFRTVLDASDSDPGVVVARDGILQWFNKDTVPHDPAPKYAHVFIARSPDGDVVTDAEGDIVPVLMPAEEFSKTAGLTGLVSKFTEYGFDLVEAATVRRQTPYLPPKWGLDESGAGCGKTTYVHNNLTGSSMACFGTKANLSDFVEKSRMNDLFKKTRLKTVGSLLVSGVSKVSVDDLFVDECMLQHAGAIFGLCAIVRPRTNMHLLGDIMQLGWINRTGSFQTRFDSIAEFAPLRRLMLISYRVPADIAHMIEPEYRKKFEEMGFVVPDKAFYTRNTILRSITVLFIRSIDELPRGDVYLTFTQAEKQQIQSAVDNKVLVIEDLIKSADGRVSWTNNEFQGNQREHTVIVRLNRFELGIFEDIHQCVVAVTRHSKSCVYATVNADDSLSDLIRATNEVRDEVVAEHIVKDKEPQMPYKPEPESDDQSESGSIGAESAEAPAAVKPPRFESSGTSRFKWRIQATEFLYKIHKDRNFEIEMLRSDPALEIMESLIAQAFWRVKLVIIE